MATPATLHQCRFADYLALEEASNTKHEYLNGEIYGMAGGTPEHAALSVAVSSASARAPRRTTAARSPTTTRSAKDGNAELLSCLLEACEPA